MLPEDPSLDDATDVWNGAPESNGAAAPLDEDTRRARLANAARAISVKLAAVDAARAATEPHAPGTRSPADSASRVVARRKPASIAAARQAGSRAESAPQPQPRRVPKSSVAQLTAHVSAPAATELDGSVDAYQRDLDEHYGLLD